MADNLPLSSADVTESGSLYLPEPSGPHRPVMGLVYLLLVTNPFVTATFSLYVGFKRTVFCLLFALNKQHIRVSDGQLVVVNYPNFEKIFF
jgi:hypothetical protein